MNFKSAFVSTVAIIMTVFLNLEEFILGFEKVVQRKVNVSPTLKIDFRMLKAAASFRFPSRLEETDHQNVPDNIIVTYKCRQQMPSKVLTRLASSNPDKKIKFFSDKAAIKFLKKEYGDFFATRFADIPDGPIKADFFRMYYLAKYGGYYCDADIVPLGSVPAAKSGEVLIPFNDNDDDKDMLNPCFIATPPNHPFMKLCVAFHTHLLKTNVKYSYWTYSIVQIASFVNMKVRFLQRRLIEQCPPRRMGIIELNKCKIWSADMQSQYFWVRDEEYSGKHSWNYQST